MNPTSQTKPVVQPTKPQRKRDERRETPVGRPLDPAQLRQIGGGNSNPVRNW